MDLGLSGRTALVCAASAGLGFAVASALAREGARVTITGRRPEALVEAAEAIRRATGAEVDHAVGDIATETGREAALAACPAPDILVNNAGGPPVGDFRTWSRETWMAALDSNMLAPIAMIQAVVDGMCERRFGRIVNITSAMVRTPTAPMGLSTGARAGLTGFVAGLSREVAARNVTINNLMPGPFGTQRLRDTAAKEAAKSGGTVESVLAARAASNPAGRLGDPEEFGAVCAFLCSAHAGYIVGQNVVVDGGATRFIL